MKFDHKSLLFLIRLIHTIIWLSMIESVFYVLVSGITGMVRLLTWISIALIFLEGVVLLLSGWVCPLHKAAQKLTGMNEINDTFLPQWVFFKGYKVLSALLFFIGLSLVLIKTWR
jgi:hypothetical protein